MYGWYKLLKETDTEMLIGYSWERDKSCDGRLIFNKETKEMTIDKLSGSADKSQTIYLICPIGIRVRNGIELGKLGMVATG